MKLQGEMMIVIKRFIKSFICLFVLLAGLFMLDTAQAKTVDVLKIKGGIGPATAEYISKGIIRANKDKSKLIVLQMDTPGGLSVSTRKIIQSILASSVPVIGFVAPRGARAASAGTYILYATSIAAMAEGTNIGAATPVSIIPSDSKSSASKRKAINDAEAFIRSLAQLHKRNEKWAVSAVKKASSLSAQEALQKGVINLIANNLPDLLSKVNGKEVSIAGKMVKINVASAAIRNIEPNWRSKFLMVIANPSITYILLMIGFFGLFFEFANPGYVLPGVVGAVSLLLALYAMQMLPINYAGLALMGIGVAFMVAEVFIGSFGILGIGGFISFAIGSVMLIKSGIPGFSISLYLLIGVPVLTALFFTGLLYLIVRDKRKPVFTSQTRLTGEVGDVRLIKGQLWLEHKGELWRIDNPEGISAGDRVVVQRTDGARVTVINQQ